MSYPPLQTPIYSNPPVPRITSIFLCFWGCCCSNYDDEPFIYKVGNTKKVIKGIDEAIRGRLGSSRQYDGSVVDGPYYTVVLFVDGREYEPSIDTTIFSIPSTSQYYHPHNPPPPPPQLGMKTGGVRRMNIPPELAFVEGVGEGKPGPMPAGYGPQRQVADPLPLPFPYADSNPRCQISPILLHPPFSYMYIVTLIPLPDHIILSHDDPRQSILTMNTNLLYYLTHDRMMTDPDKNG